MRNQIGIPPLEREVDTGSPLEPGSAAPKVPHRRSHPEMPADVAEGARHGEGPHVGGFYQPVTERDTGVGVYIGLAIGAIALIVIVMILIAIF